MYEFNEAAKGYWRKYERDTQWPVREMVWTLICGNPHIKTEDKPKHKTDIYRLSMDEVKKVKKATKITEQDLLIYQQLGFNKK